MDRRGAEETWTRPQASFKDAVAFTRYTSQPFMKGTERWGGKKKSKKRCNHEEVGIGRPERSLEKSLVASLSNLRQIKKLIGDWLYGWPG